MKKNFGIFNLLLILLVLIFFDYASKLWAIKNLFVKYQSIELTSFLSVTPVWNSGISFGFFQDLGEMGRYGFTIFAFIVSVWLIFSSFKMPRYSSLGFILMSGGGSQDPYVFNKEIYNFRRIRLAPALVIIGFGIAVYSIFTNPLSRK